MDRLTIATVSLGEDGAAGLLPEMADQAGEVDLLLVQGANGWQRDGQRLRFRAGRLLAGIGLDRSLMTAGTGGRLPALIFWRAGRLRPVAYYDPLWPGVPGGRGGLAEFTARLERRRSRPIRLCPFRAGPGVPCGVWIATANADYIYHEQGTTRFHASLIVLHEIAHMLLGHQEGPAWQHLARQIAPGVDPGLVRLILGRSAYALPEEREAETLASRILARATWPGTGGRSAVPAGYAR